MFLFRAVPFAVPFRNRRIVMSREEQRVKSASLRQEYERVFRLDLDDYTRSHPRLRRASEAEAQRGKGESPPFSRCGARCRGRFSALDCPQSARFGPVGDVMLP